MKLRKETDVLAILLYLIASGIFIKGVVRCHPNLLTKGVVMKTLLIICLVNSACLAVSERLLDAIEKVESNGNHHAIGDGGRSLGNYQIMMPVIKDVNKYYHKNYTSSDRRNPVKAREICRLYLDMYGKGLSDIQQARIWNGGPKGHLKKCTLEYAKRIERAMR